MKKLVQLRKMLLVAVGLLVGANAWGATNEYDFNSWVTKNCTGNGSSRTLILTGNEITTADGASVKVISDLDDFKFDGRFAIDDTGNVLLRNGDSSNGSAPTNKGIQSKTANKHLSILNLKKDDIVTIVAGYGVATIISANVTVNGASAENLVLDNKMGEETVCTITSSGNLDLKLDAWAVIMSVTIESNAETVTAPTLAITGANGAERTVTMTPGTTDAKDATVAVHYTTDGTTPTASSTKYTAPVKVSTTTKFTAVTISSTGATSATTELTVEAGTTEKLAEATVIHSAVNQYTIQSNQSAVIGEPKATIHYQVGTGAEQTSTEASVNVAITEDGTITYWLTAEGYASTEKQTIDVYTSIAKRVINTVNFCTSNDNDWAQQGDEVEIAEDETNAYYQYKDQAGNVVSAGLLATTFNNATSTWRIQRYYGGTLVYNTTEYIALLGLKKGQIVQYKCNAVPTIVANLTALEAETYTGTYGYSVAEDGNAIISVAKNTLITQIDIYTTTPLPVSITDAGWATLYTDCALNFEGSGLTAYTAAYDGEVVTLTEVKNVPANTGVVLKGAAKEYEVALLADSKTAQGDLKGSTTADLTYSEDAKNNYYVLALNDSKDAQFTLLTSGKVAAGKAYLEIAKPAADEPEADEAAARTLEVVIAGETTGIVNANREAAADGRIYNLNGQVVAQPAKGLYIVNGKKVIIK